MILNLIPKITLFLWTGTTTAPCSGQQQKTSILGSLTPENKQLLPRLKDTREPLNLNFLGLETNLTDFRADLINKIKENSNFGISEISALYSNKKTLTNSPVHFTLFMTLIWESCISQEREKAFSGTLNSKMEIFFTIKILTSHLNLEEVTG